ncbi:DUF3025 domain-containing protein [Azohydromonas sediminis]|uniref:DUF3025 domain-containing protein n=1 Tax=Azohydromonas sediminis TaxID=2259674 RepID=UPI000E65DB19|nr:DUF3025 domain-containing protein [Azohydromonas sediminis]
MPRAASRAPTEPPHRPPAEPDWSRPWFAPWARLGPALWAVWRGSAALADALNVTARVHGVGAAPVFVAAAGRRAAEPYEALVARTRAVPVRDTLHDALNGLVWLHRPALKWALNHAHAQQIARHGAGGRRGAVRDALTLLDENGVLLAAPPGLVEALRRRDWAALFVGHRAAWAQARLEVVGHGLLEQLARAPRKALTAHAWCVPAAHFDAPALPSGLTPASWTPLPVLGVPGWWPDNDALTFYADAAVFRPGPGTRRDRPQLSALSGQPVGLPRAPTQPSTTTTP